MIKGWKAKLEAVLSIGDVHMVLVQTKCDLPASSMAVTEYVLPMFCYSIAAKRLRHWHPNLAFDFIVYPLSKTSTLMMVEAPHSLIQLSLISIQLSGSTGAQKSDSIMSKGADSCKFSGDW